jgi:serine/threonine protein kinase
MALPQGTRLGSYEILALLGAGGMGEKVYRATDTVLKRQVALKVLPPEVADDPERVARFQREAEVLASLNHPNIAHLYGLERSGGTLALVMELVEGPTLADRIKQGAIPVDEALPIAKQIAEALEAAHEQGIIHRDLKPANIKVRDDGTVKVLDFGLAKAMEPIAGAGSSALTNSPTVTSPALMTGVGVLLGTAAYMSPEQAKGRPADKRSDVWAFGCVLYEMLTGRLAFEGEDVNETLAAILRSEPALTRLPRNVPLMVRAAIADSLVKNPNTRVHDVAAIRFALAHADAEPATTRHPPARRMAFGAVLVALVAAALLIEITRRPPPGIPGRATKSSVLLPAGEQFTAANTHLVTLSRDGRRLAYVANERINLRSLDSLESTVVNGTEGFGGGNDSSRMPFFSPDGEWLGFWQASQLKRFRCVAGPRRALLTQVRRYRLWAERSSAARTGNTTTAS